MLNYHHKMNSRRDCILKRLSILHAIKVHKYSCFLDVFFLLYLAKTRYFCEKMCLCDTESTDKSAKYDFGLSQLISINLSFEMSENVQRSSDDRFTVGSPHIVVSVLQKNRKSMICDTTVLKPKDYEMLIFFSMD